MNKSLLARTPHEISKPSAAAIISVTSAQAVKLCRQNDFEVAGVLEETWKKHGFDIKCEILERISWRKIRMASSLTQSLKVEVLFLKHCLSSEAGFLLQLECLQMVCVFAHMAGKEQTDGLRCLPLGGYLFLSMLYVLEMVEGPWMK